MKWGSLRRGVHDGRNSCSGGYGEWVRAPLQRMQLSQTRARGLVQPRAVKDRRVWSPVLHLRRVGNELMQALVNLHTHA